MGGWIIMELALGTNLSLQCLHRSKASVARNAPVYTQQLLSAIKHMHSRKVVHRDLKPENIMLSEATKQGHIVLIDFDLSAQTHNGNRLHTICGTHRYLAPEMILCDRGARQGYDGYAIDMWGVGVIVFAMLAGIAPFQEHDLKRTHDKILSCDWSLSRSSRGPDRSHSLDKHPGWSPLPGYSVSPSNGRVRHPTVHGSKLPTSQKSPKPRF